MCSQSRKCHVRICRTVPVSSHRALLLSGLWSPVPHWSVRYSDPGLRTFKFYLPCNRYCPSTRPFNIWIKKSFLDLKWPFLSKENLLDLLFSERFDSNVIATQRTLSDYILWVPYKVRRWLQVLDWILGWRVIAIKGGENIWKMCLVWLTNKQKMRWILNMRSSGFSMAMAGKRPLCSQRWGNVKLEPEWITRFKQMKRRVPSFISECMSWSELNG